MSMLPISRCHSHFVFGVIQSGLTSALAAGVASANHIGSGSFLLHWLASWLISWMLMLPIVLFAAPLIRQIALALTRPDASTID
jgi:Protein of unknown function (DUF2798)